MVVGCVVSNEVVPPQGWIFGGLCVKHRYLIVPRPLLSTCLEEQDSVAGSSEIRRQRATSGAGADYDVVVHVRLHRFEERDESVLVVIGQIAPKLVTTPHHEVRALTELQEIRHQSPQGLVSRLAPELFLGYVFQA